MTEAYIPKEISNNPESYKPLARAMATRHLNESHHIRCQIAHFLQTETEAPPVFFQEALSDAYSLGYEKFLKMPSPFAYIFEGKDHIIDTISDGDWTEFVNDSFKYSSDLEGYSGVQIKEWLRVLSREVMPLDQPPEFNYQELTTVINKATEVTHTYNIDLPDLFIGNSNYDRLISESLNPQDYKNAWQKNQSGTTFDQYLSNVILIHLSQKIYNTSNQVQRDDLAKQALEATKHIREDNEGVAYFRGIYDTIQTGLDAVLDYRLQRFWN
jgi:hypothetical protein